MFTEALKKQAAGIINECRKRGLMIATAESCTGGLIAALLTEIPGSSTVFERGFVTYSNHAKTQMLAVDSDIIAENGAVSEAVACAMSIGARKHAKVDIAVAVTGIAGPDGGSAEKPVGTVCIAIASEADNAVQTFHFKGDRGEVRLQSVEAALAMIREMLTRSFSSVA